MVPERYRKTQGDMGPAIYTPMDDPRAILLGLQRWFGKRMSTEKEEATQQWGQSWNSSEPIENSFSDSKSYTSKLT